MYIYVYRDSGYSYITVESKTQVRTLERKIGNGRIVSGGVVYEEIHDRPTAGRVV